MYLLSPAGLSETVSILFNMFMFKHTGESVQKTASATMQRTVEQIRAIRGEKTGSQLRGDELLNEAVSFDGTWAKRGFSSFFGVQAIIHMEIGKLVARQPVDSNICNICRVKEAELKDKSSDDLIAWRKTHQTASDKNTCLAKRHGGSR